MKNEQNKSSGLPLIIIGIVAVAVIGSIYWYYNSTKSTPNSNKARANTSNQSRESQMAAAATAPPGAQPPNLLGAPTASVTVEEFADFQCPSCGTMHPVMKEIQQIYGSRIRFIFRQFPLQMHDKAYDAAVASEAAGMQGSDKFWAMQNLLYTNQKDWALDKNFRQTLAGYAQSIGLDVGKFQSDSAGLPAKKRVDDDLARGRALNVGSTPTILVNGQSIPAPEMNVASLRNFIDAELQKAAAPRNANQPAPAAANPAAAPSNSTASDSATK